jgi:hypothetical protein
MDDGTDDSGSNEMQICENGRPRKETVVGLAVVTLMCMRDPSSVLVENVLREFTATVRKFRYHRLINLGFCAHVRLHGGLSKHTEGSELFLCADIKTTATPECVF